MIKHLNGIHETVNFREDTNICLYDNNEYEEYPTHWHTPIEIIMPVENSYSVKYREDATFLRENDILLICPGILHSIPAAHGRRYIFQAEIYSVLLIKELESVLTILSPAILITPENSPAIYDRMHEIVLEIVQEYKQAPAMCEASIYAKLTEMIVALGRIHTDSCVHFDVSHSKQKEYIDKFMSICNYISEHCTEDLNLDMVSGLSGFSKYHFTRLFKQFTNVSFYKYLNQKRIAKAEQLLIDPTMSVTDVSLSSGFSSLSAFIRMFKIIKGCTPSEFRSMYDTP
ncbi:MAG: AraC family transcriptional regulator [Lachnospiraceae bacterium]|nr:AraC family transcriptional regulator [Lachnospiraceae bacterium]MDD3795241.1 AraC family transcriptional regulator [Lachnospiraceae bacterium]